jgi:hypothetical protein
VQTACPKLHAKLSLNFECDENHLVGLSLVSSTAEDQAYSWRFGEDTLHLVEVNRHNTKIMWFLLMAFQHCCMFDFARDPSLEVRYEDLLCIMKSL